MDKDKDRQATIDWAQALLRDPSRWVMLDTETTGLGEADEIVQIAVISPSGETLINSLLRPSKPIPRGILDADMRKSRSTIPTRES